MVRCLVAFELPPLPYAEDALEPYMSSATIRMHHEGNQRRYVEKTNKLLARLPRYQRMSVRQVVELAARARANARGHDRVFWHDLFDQSSQAWNHAFFWHCMRPGGGGIPPRPFAHLPGEIRKAAATVFGSGWVWVYRSPRGLAVIGTPNAERPPGPPILVCDLWEYAFILDYPVDRKGYVDAWLDHLVNWDFAQQMLHGHPPPDLR